jgi:membrane protein DedA with SNARE-associated domain
VCLGRARYMTPASDGAAVDQGAAAAVRNPCPLDGLSGPVVRSFGETVPKVLWVLRQARYAGREALRMDFLDGAFAQHLVHYGYGAIFLIVMMESGGIPMPGETILVSAAAYAGTRHALDIRYVIAAAAGGAIVGDNIGFWVGREFGEPLLEKWGHLIGLDARKRMLGRFLFARYGGSIVFFGRFVALLRAFAALLAGANGLAPWRFFIFNAAGGITWATIFGTGGYLLGEGIRRIAGPVGWAMLALAVVIGFVLWRYYKKHEETLLAKAEREMARQV